jgi:hypothetical protein
VDGRTYPTVWIHNYFYEDTIEADVYRRLGARINWFKAVIGELQPILSRVATSIQTLAMLPGRERQGRLNDEVAQLEGELERQKASGLDLEAYLDTMLIVDGQEVPVTLADLEQVLTRLPSVYGRFTPHPQIERAYLLTWRDRQSAVTFDPAVFDAHPQTVQLLSYASALLGELLDAVERPQEASSAEGVIRAVASHPLPLRAYFAPVEGQRSPFRALGRLDNLRSVAAIGSSLVWSEGARDAATEHLRQLLAQAQAYEGAVLGARRRAEHLALVERARQVLLRAALVELTQGQQPGMFMQALPTQFSAGAILGLARHKYPFAPLLRLLGDVTDLVPSPADPLYIALQGKSIEALRGTFEELREQARELVQVLGTTAPSTEPPPPWPM